MITLFISDLHLEDAQPDTTRLLLEFLAAEAARADALYILGDLFEYWIGDDVLTPTAEAVADALRTVAQATPVYFMHGNRDFLLGPAYAERARMTLLEDPTVVDLYGTPTLLMHGDTLCTDDHAYQAFRAQVRQPAFIEMFLGKTVQERIAMAREARDASKAHTGHAAMEIMDVNEDAVRAAFEAHGVVRMIHGHTHRPAIHDRDDGRQRIVLGAWHDGGSVLRVKTDGLSLDTLT
ncbi:MAG: UDP-2,3-diacylglucosamine diphosphatase [Xanthomonadales bacterium]|nr:UDP-2,3-diacylglucosamine diphosphatase [Xanthomonadales bacterium]